MRVVLFLILVAPSIAHACSCGWSGPQRTVLPIADTAGFPIDGQIRIFASGFTPSIRARLHTEYRLIGPAGPVPFDARVTRTRIDLVPKEPLQPDTRYRIEQLFAYSLDGERITDDKRLRLTWDGGWAALRYWYPLQTFTTARLVSPTPPKPVITAADAHFPRGGGDCGPGVALWADMAPQNRPQLVAELEVEGYGVVSTRPVPVGRAFSVRVSDLNCNPDKFSLKARGPFTVKVAYIAPDGTRTLSASRVVEGFGRSRGHVEHDPPGWATLWFKGTVKPTPITPAVGPPGCVNGVELARSTQLSSVGGPTAYDTRNAILQVGSTLQALAAQDGRIQQLGPKTRQTIIKGDTVRSAPGVNGTVAVVTRHDDKSSTLTALGFNAAGAVVWRTPIATKNLNWKARIVTCKDAVAVAWSQVVGQQYVAAKSRWALLDPKTGAVRRQASEGLPIEGEGAALGCDGAGGIWLVGRARRGRETHLYRIDEKTPVAMPIKGLRGSTFAMAPHGDGFVLLMDDDGIQGVVVHRTGQVKGKPFRLSTTGRKPTLAPLTDQTFIAAWERPGIRTFATAFDLRGHIAYPRPIGGDWITPTVRVQGERITLAVTEDTHDAARKGITLARLRCASRAMQGPPPRLR